MRLRALVVAAFGAVAIAAHAATDSLAAPAALQRGVEKAIETCLKRAGADAAACLEPAKARWREAVEAAKERIGQSRNPNCAAALQQVEQRWHAYADGLMRSRTVGGLSANADDEIELPLLEHLYAMTHWLARQPVCRRPR
jgi:hypothetical protein